MNKHLMNFLERVLKTELKWMYSHDIDSDAFGVETDRYRMVKSLLDKEIELDYFLDYFQKNYPNDEKNFIDHVKELMAL